MINRALSLLSPLGLVSTLLLTQVVGLGSLSCRSTQRLTRTLYPPSDLQRAVKKNALYMKVHMRDGNVYVLKERRVSSGADTIFGKGLLLDLNRDTVAERWFALPLDSVGLIETNEVSNSPSVAALTVVTGLSLILTGICITNPKACFGSCPTFYVAEADSMHLRAEGFSSSIAPSLEADDVDALRRTVSGPGSFRLEMRNEAYETHVVRHADLLIVPRERNETILAATDGTFYRVKQISPPIACTGPEGEILPLVAELDRFERFSPADSLDLATRETIELEFEISGDGNRGLVIGARQSLLSTFLFYQTLAYMGSEATAWLARLERETTPLSIAGITGEAPTPLNAGPGRVMGGIEVLTQNDVTGAWRVVAEVNEAGPLATDLHLLRLPKGIPQNGRTRLRIRCAKGHWRIDYLALAEIGPAVEPIRLHPERVYRDEVPDIQACDLLADESTTLVTMPGDRYTLEYRLPSGTYELFLESRGYYLEWIREEWIAEENRQKVLQLFYAPEKALRELAPKYKEMEPEMEDIFWRSRYAR